MQQAKLLTLVQSEYYVNDVTNINFMDNKTNIKRNCNRDFSDPDTGRGWRHNVTDSLWYIAAQHAMPWQPETGTLAQEQHLSVTKERISTFEEKKQRL